MATCSPSKLSTFSRLVQCISFLFLYLNTIKPIYARQNRNTPHDHRGKLTPYAPGPFLNLSLDNGDEKTLSGGNAVMKVLADEDEPSGGGKSICVQDVEAPKEAVWNQILDLDHYVGKVSKLKECSNYLVKTRPDGTFQVKTKMVVGVMPGYKYEYYCDHTYHPDQNSVVWTLDYEKTSDFDDVAGHWHLQDHPKKPGCTRVFYACDIKFKTALPGPVLSFLTKKALKQATSWVKRESEASPDSPIPSQFQFGYAN